jgi:hypothetical protein
MYNISTYIFYVSAMSWAWSWYTFFFIKMNWNPLKNLQNINVFLWPFSDCLELTTPHNTGCTSNVYNARSQGNRNWDLTIITTFYLTQNVKNLINISIFGRSSHLFKSLRVLFYWFVSSRIFHILKEHFNSVTTGYANTTDSGNT